MTNCLISYGANLEGPFGKPAETLKLVFEELRQRNLEIVKNSRLYSSLAFPDPRQPRYLNGCLELKVNCNAADLLVQMKRIEIKMGRREGSRWSSRICDLDLLSFANMVCPSNEVFNYWYKMPLKKQMIKKPMELLLPHPRLQDRAFVLIPLIEVAPNWIHPVLNLSARQMCDSLSSTDQQSISLI